MSLYKRIFIKSWKQNNPTDSIRIRFDFLLFKSIKLALKKSLFAIKITQHTLFLPNNNLYHLDFLATPTHGGSVAKKSTDFKIFKLATLCSTKNQNKPCGTYRKFGKKNQNFNKFLISTAENRGRKMKSEQLIFDTEKSWIDDLELCEQTGEGSSTNQIYRYFLFCLHCTVFIFVFKNIDNNNILNQSL
jgi:hypothetical protein